MTSLMTETVQDSSDSELPAEVRHRVLDEWATGVELSDVLGVSGLLRRAYAVPPMRTAVRCGDERLDYAGLFERLGRRGRTGPAESVEAGLGVLADLAAGDADAVCVRVGAESLAMSTDAVVAAVADRRAIAAERRCDRVDPALGSADVRLVAGRWGDADVLIELLAALADGATLVVPTADQRTDPAVLGGLIAAQAATHVVASADILRRCREFPATPSVRRWDVLIGDAAATESEGSALLEGAVSLDDSALFEDGEVAGSVCPPGLGDDLGALAPRAVASLCYRPPEYAGVLARGPLDGTGRVRPIPGARVLVLDACGRPVAPGRVGEVYAGGAALAESDVAEEFSGRRVSDPFPPDGFAGPLVRTGARARWTAQGWLVLEKEQTE